MITLRNSITSREILDLAAYESARDAIRLSAIAARGIRRVDLGPNATVAFESRETVVYQIQEMLRAERIAGAREVQHEIETYSELLPAPDGLAATVMFEFPDAAERAQRLVDLRGFEDQLRLDFGNAGSARAKFDRRQIDPERISSVQFVRFDLDPGQCGVLRSGGRIRLVSDHPAYRYDVELSRRTASALAADVDEASRTID